MTNSHAWTARKLLRAARVGTLATSAEGLPFASLVTPATAPDLSLLLLLSDLSEHTRHLRADPRCAVLIAGQPETANPQTTPRVSVMGTAELVAETALRSRYLAVHPYAALYADFGDFHLWRIRFREAAFVGGFARAARLRAADLQPDTDAVAAIAAAEPSIIHRCNLDHPDVTARLAGQPCRWEMVAIDTDGCDLADPERTIRIPWSRPVTSAEDVRQELVRLAGGD
ncbi:MAG TPA: pyridoxamine 5'-phosphate oxidase family protein [Acetobacteraceae bacterium]|nr:pyridoxamine 5'-phosphate oxidase family protein [Acetobacteraceae bacterium]